MNPEKDPPTPREELEARLTALLLGELPPEEAAALQARMAAEPDLATLHARLRKAMELLREATALPEPAAPTTPVQLSSERRERLLAHFQRKPAPPLASTPAPGLQRTAEKPARNWSWVVPLGVAAALVALFGALAMPTFSNVGPSAARVAAAHALFLRRLEEERKQPADLQSGTPDSHEPRSRFVTASPPAPLQEELAESRAKNDEDAPTAKDSGSTLRAPAAYSGKPVAGKIILSSSRSLEKAIPPAGGLAADAASAPGAALPASNLGESTAGAQFGAVLEDQKQPFNYDLGKGTVVLNGANTDTDGTTLNNGTLTFHASTFGGTIRGNLSDTAAAGSGGVTRGDGNSISASGTGNWTLNGINTYTGGTTVDAGSLALSGTSTFGGNGSAEAPGRDTIYLGRKGSTTHEDIAALNQAVGTLNGGSNTYTGTTTLFAGTQSVGATSSVTGSGGLAKSGAGTVTFGSSSSNTSSGTGTPGAVIDGLPVLNAGSGTVSPNAQLNFATDSASTATLVPAPRLTIAGGITEPSSETTASRSTSMLKSVTLVADRDEAEKAISYPSQNQAGVEGAQTRIAGNARTDDKAIRREFAFQPAEVPDPKILEPVEKDRREAPVTSVPGLAMLSTPAAGSAGAPTIDSTTPLALTDSQPLPGALPLRPAIQAPNASAPASPTAPAASPTLGNTRSRERRGAAALNDAGSDAHAPAPATAVPPPPPARAVDAIAPTKMARLQEQTKSLGKDSLADLPVATPSPSPTADSKGFAPKKEDRLYSSVDELLDGAHVNTPQKNLPAQSELQPQIADVPDSAAAAANKPTDATRLKVPNFKDVLFGDGTQGTSPVRKFKDAALAGNESTLAEGHQAANATADEIEKQLVEETQALAAQMHLAKAKGGEIGVPDAIKNQRQRVAEAAARAMQIRARDGIVDPDPDRDNSNLGHTAQLMVDVHQQRAEEEIRVVELERQLALIKNLRPAELQDALKTLGVEDAVVAKNLPLLQDAEAEKARLSNEGVGANNPRIKALEAKTAKYSKILNDQLGMIRNADEKKLQFEKDKLSHLQQMAADARAKGPGETEKLTEYVQAKNDYLRAQKVLEGLEAYYAAQKAKEPAKAEPKRDAAEKPAAPPPAIPQPEIQTRENAFSTFSLNVSDVSFKLAAASLEQGRMPDVSTVRSEEFINAFDYRDPEPAPSAPLAFAAERARYPFAQNRDLLRFSVKTAATGRQPGRPLNIVLLLDKSGSMERADRVNILREALRVLAAQLQPQDQLSIVTFARTPRLWADGVAGDKAGELIARVSEITPEGGTNLEAALDLGYETALRHYAVTSINRVVLFTDGAANLGDVNPDALTKKVEAKRRQGVALDCFGIGWEGYNDDLLEQLTRNADGRYGFINTPEEAAANFATQLAGALQVAASDVKVQVEFNPRRVTAYRQIGYAKHQLTKEQFRDNSVNAAQIGAAESGNALYVIAVDPQGDGDLATVRVRYRMPGTSDYREHEWVVSFTGNVPPLEQASPALRLAGTAAAFSEMLAASPYAAEVTSDRLLGLLEGVPAIYGADPRPQKLEWMIRTVKSVSGR